MNPNPIDPRFSPNTQFYRPDEILNYSFDESSKSISVIQTDMSGSIYIPDVVNTIAYELTRPNDTNNYAAGDVISNSTTTPTLITFTNVSQTNNKGVIITGLRVQTNDIVKFLGKRFRLHLYRETDISPINDNDPFSLLYVNANKIVGYVDFTFPSVVDGGSTDSIAVQIDGVNKTFKLIGNCICAQLQTLDAITLPIANAKILIQLHVIQTN